MKAVKFLLGGALVLSTVALGAMQAGAAQQTGGAEQNSPARSTCTGTLTSPGVLSGTYAGNVVVSGLCVVNGGAALVKGDLRLAPGAGLNATFALNDTATPDSSSLTGTSSLTVKGDIAVERGAVLAMGCEPIFSPCSDDPAASTGGTLTGHNRVGGDIHGVKALALLVHASAIGGDVTQVGGGGGVSCAVPTTGVFSLMMSPVFSDYEDNSIAGDLSVSGLQTCWFGALRNHVSEDVTANHNTMADSDASEVLSNVVSDNISCFNNSPAVQYGDSMGSPNVVKGHASGECGFKVLQPNPAPSGTPSPISIRG